jgi:hypothetical protein
MIARTVMEASRAQRIALWWALAFGVLCSLVVAYRLLALSLVIGSPAGHWTYVYLQGFQRAFVGASVRALLVCGLLIAAPRHLAARREWWLVAAWLVAGLYIQGTMRHQTRYTMEQIFVSDGASSFYSPTLQRGPRRLIQEFDRIRPDLPTHARSNMPGKLVFVSVLGRLSARPAVLAWIIVLVSNLGGVLLYLFIRDLFADRAVALVALIFYLLVPAKLYFLPVLNTVTPVVVLACAWLWQRSLMTAQLAYAAGFGVAVYALMFFDPLGLVMGLLFAALAAHHLRIVERPWRQFFMLSLCSAIGFGAVYLVFVLGFRFDVLATFRVVAGEARSFNLVAGRPYGIWVRQNLRDFLFGMGACNAVLACGVTAWSLWRGRVSGWREPLVVYTLACAVVLAATDLIGVNRGEVVRLWIFLACFFQLPAAYACARLESRGAVMLVASTMIVQDVLGTGMLNFAQP